MTGYETILVDDAGERVRVVTLNRPDKRNAISGRLRAIDWLWKFISGWPIPPTYIAVRGRIASNTRRTSPVITTETDGAISKPSGRPPRAAHPAPRASA